MDARKLRVLDPKLSQQAQGTLIATGTGSMNGTLTTGVGSLLRVQGVSTLGGHATLTVPNGFTNQGTIELSGLDGYGGTLAVTSGTLVNAAGATIQTVVGGGGPRALAAELNNQGTVTTAQGLELNRASADHLNSGTIDLTTGSLTVSQTGTTPSFTNTGTINVASGQGLVSTGGALNQNGGTISGAGYMLLQGSATGTLNTPLGVAALSIHTSTATLTSNLSTAVTDLVLFAATLNGAVTVTNAAGKTVTCVRKHDPPGLGQPGDPDRDRNGQHERNPDHGGGVAVAGARGQHHRRTCDADGPERVHQSGDDRAGRLGRIRRDAGGNQRDAGERGGSDDSNGDRMGGTTGAGGGAGQPGDGDDDGRADDRPGVRGSREQRHDQRDRR